MTEIQRGTLEAGVLEAAMALAAHWGNGKRTIDMLDQLLLPFTLRAELREPWHKLVGAITALDYAQDPAPYCSACEAAGERVIGDSGLQECEPCHGRGYLGPKLPPLYAPGDELLEPVF
jgi:hypothetical protein